MSQVESTAPPRMHVVSEGLIASAHPVILFVLIYITSHRRDLRLPDRSIRPFRRFLAASSLTDVMDAWDVWGAPYWLETAIRVITVLSASIPSVVPAAMAFVAEHPVAAEPAAATRRERIAGACKSRSSRRSPPRASHDLRSPLTAIAGQAGHARAVPCRTRTKTSVGVCTAFRGASGRCRS